MYNTIKFALYRLNRKRTSSSEGEVSYYLIHMTSRRLNNAPINVKPGGRARGWDFDIF